MIEGSGRTGGGKSGHPGTAFYIEALLLAGVFTIVVLILTRVFVMSGQMGKDAALLTNAVHLAENGAEAVASSHSLEEVRKLLEENGNGEILESSKAEAGREAYEGASGENRARILRVHYDEELNPDAEGGIWMDIQWIEPDSGEEGLVKSIINIYRTDRPDPVYTLETEVFISEKGGQL